jgi:flagellar protein FliS
MSAFVPSAVVRHVYVEQGILTESPTQLVLRLLDFTLGAARKGDAGRVRRGFQELLEGLNYRYETAWDLQAFYEACLALVEQAQFGEVAQRLQEVRDAWAGAFQLGPPVPRPTAFVRAARRRGFESHV